VTVHDLRHTFALHAAQAGVPIPRIQKLLGHATVARAIHEACTASVAAPECWIADPERAHKRLRFTPTVTAEVRHHYCHGERGIVNAEFEVLHKLQ